MTLDLNTEAFTEKVDINAIEELAKFVVLEEAENEKLAEQMKQRAAKIDTAKGDISRMLHEAGMESAQLSCGLTPKRKVKRAFYAVGGLNTEPVFDWLKTKRIYRNVLIEIVAEYNGGDEMSKQANRVRLDTEIRRRWPDGDVIDTNSAVANFDPMMSDAIKEKSFSLEDIIDTSPRVHFQTLQSALTEFEGLGGELPESVFTVSETETITMYHKKKFLEAQKTDGN